MPIDPNIALQGKPVQFDGAGITNALQHGLALRMQQEQHAQQMQLGAQQLQSGQQALDQTKAVNDSYRDSLSVNPDGTAAIDQAKLTNALAKSGHGSIIPKILKDNADFQKSTAELSKLRSEVAEKEQDYAGSVGAVTKAANNDPHLFLVNGQHAINAKAVDAHVIAPLMQQVQQALEQDPTGESARALVGQIADHFIAQSPQQQKLINEGKTAEGARMRGEAAQNADQRAAQMQPLTVEAKQGEIATGNAARPGIQAKSDIEAASAAALKNMTRADWKTGLDATIPDKDGPLYKRTAAAMDMALSRGDLKGAQAALKDAGDQLGRVETGVATAKATAPIKIDVAAASATARADAAGLTDDDYKRSGEQFARTGIMPAMGRDSITRGKIAHEANQWARDNGFAPADIVTMQAAYAGDKESLKKFQAQRDQIVSFEQTAQKNLDLFIGAASKIPDTGLPWLNMPIRMLDQKLVGSANMAAVNAARQVANNEIAKVTSGGGLGGVVSDSARHEVESYNPKDATFAQTLAVAKMLKQDMANRHQSMDASLSDIKQRIGGGAPQAGKPEKWGFDSSGKLVKQ